MEKSYLLGNLGRTVEQCRRGILLMLQGAKKEMHFELFANDDPMDFECVQILDIHAREILGDLEAFAKSCKRFEDGYAEREKWEWVGYDDRNI